MAESQNVVSFLFQLRDRVSRPLRVIREGVSEFRARTEAEAGRVRTAFAPLADVFRRVRDVASDMARRARGDFGQLRSTVVGTASAMRLAIEPLRSSLVGLAAAFLGFQAVRKGLEAAEGQVQSTARLRAALREENAALLPRLQAQAVDVQRRTVLGDELIEGVQAELLNRSVPVAQIERATEAVVQASSALKISVEQAAEQVARSYGGIIPRELSYAVPEIRALTAEQLRAGMATDLLLEKFRGFAEAEAATPFGRAAQLANQVGDVYERLGDRFIEVKNRILQALVPALDRLAVVLESPAGQGFLDMIGRIGAFLIKHAGSIAVFVGTAMTIQAATGAFGAFKTAAAGGATTLAAMTTAAGQLPLPLRIIAGLLLTILNLLNLIRLAVLSGPGLLVLKISAIIAGVLELIKWLTGWKVGITDIISLVGDLWARWKDGSLTILLLVQSFFTQLDILGVHFRTYLYDVPVAVLDELIARAKEKFAELVTAAKDQLSKAGAFVSGFFGGADGLPATQRQQELHRRAIAAGTDQPLPPEQAPRENRPIADIIAEKVAQGSQRAAEIEAEANRRSVGRGINDVNQRGSQDTAAKLEADRQQRDLLRKREQEEEARALDELAKLRTEKTKEILDAERKLELEKLRDLYEQKKVPLEEYFTRRRELEAGAVEQEIADLRQAIGVQEEQAVAKRAAGEVATAQYREIRALTEKLLPLESQRAIILQQIGSEERQALQTRRESLRLGREEVEVLRLRSTGRPEDATAADRLELLNRQRADLARLQAAGLGQPALDDVRASQSSALMEFDRQQQLKAAEAELQKLSAAQERYNAELARSAHLTESGSITHSEAQRRNAQALRELQATARQVGSELEGKLASDLLSDEDVDRFRQRRADVEAEIAAMANTAARTAREVADSMRGPLSEFLVDLAKKGESFGQKILNLAGGIAESIGRLFADKAAKLIVDGLGDAFVRMVSGQQAAEAAQTAATTAGAAQRTAIRAAETTQASAQQASEAAQTAASEAGKTAATTAGAAARGAVRTGEAATSAAIEAGRVAATTAAEGAATGAALAGAAARVPAKAAEAGAGAAASQAGVPVVGPGMAIAAMVAVMAAVMGLMALVTRRNQGGLIPGEGPDRDSTLVLATPREFMIRRKAVEKYGIAAMEKINRGEVSERVMSLLLGSPMMPTTMATSSVAGATTGAVQALNEGGVVKALGSGVDPERLANVLTEAIEKIPGKFLGAAIVPDDATYRGLTQGMVSYMVDELTKHPKMNVHIRKESKS